MGTDPFRLVGTLSDAGAAWFAGTGTMVLADTAFGGRLFALSPGGDLLLWSDPQAGLYTAGQAVVTTGQAWTGSPLLAQLTLGGGRALAMRDSAGNTVLRWLDGQGGISAPDVLLHGVGAVNQIGSAAMTGGADLLYWTAPGVAGVSLALRSAAGVVSPLSRLAVDGGGDGSDISDIATFTRGASVFLCVASRGADSVTLLQLDRTSGAMLAATRLSPAENLAVDQPSRLVTVQSGGRDYLLIGATGTSSITVAELTAAGRLVVTDQVGDDLFSRFQGMTVLKAATIGDRSFIIAGGVDDGLSLMTLLPGGRLLQLGVIADSTAMALDNPSALTVRAAAGGGLDLFVASGSEAGVTRLQVDTGSLAPVLRAAATGGGLAGDARNDLLVGGAGEDKLDGGAGNDILLDGAGRDTLTGGSGADIFVMTADGALDRIAGFTPGEDRLDLSAYGRVYSRDAFSFHSITGGVELRFGDERLQIFSADGRGIDPASLGDRDLLDLWHIPVVPVSTSGVRIEGGAGADLLFGTSGNDTMTGGAGRDSLSGGAGEDTVLGQGQDAGFDPFAAQAYRLYRATLDRPPEATGLLGWSGRLAAGMTLQEAAAGFVASREFQQRYGATTDAQFVTLLYNNVLDRNPEPAGLATWTTALANGMSRERVVLGFSESQEFRKTTAPETLGASRAGLQADWADDVYRLYRATLDRPPEAAGLLHWSGQMAAGMTPLAAAAGFVASREFQQRYGATTDAQFVTLLYNNVLDRNPEPAGLATWTTALAKGMSRERVVLGFSESQEFRKTTAAALTDWMRTFLPDDQLSVSPGADLLMGGIGADSFVLAPGLGSGHRIADLEPWDRIDLTAFGYADAAAALAHVTATAAGALFSDQGVSVTFCDLSPAAITADMLLL